MKVGQLEFPIEPIEAFCRKWNVMQLSLFGSVLTENFRPDSDVDVLVIHGPGGSPEPVGLFDKEDELSAIFGGREIHLVERRNITNPFIRYHALTTRKVIYAA